MRYGVVIINFAVFCLSVLLLTVSSLHAQDITFTDISAQAGISQVSPTWGASCMDINQDGLEDIYVDNHQYFFGDMLTQSPPALFLNQGNATFSDVHKAYGIGEFGDLHGVSWGDFNNDGYSDLYEVTGGGTGGPAQNMLYQNNGGISTTDIAALAGVDLPGGQGRGSCWLDFDNDGFIDLYVMNGEVSGVESSLFRNNGDGTFVDVGLQSGTRLSKGSFPQACSSIDYDHDGKEDLTISGSRRFFLLHNNGDGTFSDVTAAVGLGNLRSIKGFSWGDYNNDGYMDIYFSVAPYGNDALVVNSAEVDFASNISPGAEKGLDFQTDGIDVTFDFYDFAWRVNPALIFIGQNKVQPGVVPFVLRSDNPDVQGKPVYIPGDATAYYVWFDVQGWHVRGNIKNGPRGDHFQGILTGSGNFLGAQSVGITPPVGTYQNRLYENTGNGTFVDVTAQAGVGDVGWSVNTFFADMDNDGYLDIYSVNRGQLYNAPNVLYRNNGDKTFTDIASFAGVTADSGGRGENGIYGDFNNDGFLDIFVVNGEGAAPFSYGPHMLFQNNGNANHWLNVKLVGTISNRDAIGATVKAVTSAANQVRYQNNGASLYSQNSSVIHFGLGAETVVNELRINWPSGMKQTIQNISADQTIVVAEPAPVISMIPISTTIAQGGTLQYSVTVENMSSKFLPVDIWDSITLPSGRERPNTAPLSFMLAPGEVRTKQITKNVPATVNAGTYIYRGHIGNYPKVWAEDQFIVDIVPLP